MNTPPASRGVEGCGESGRTSGRTHFYGRFLGEGEEAGGIMHLRNYVRGRGRARRSNTKGLFETVHSQSLLVFFRARSSKGFLRFRASWSHETHSQTRALVSDQDGVGTAGTTPRSSGLSKAALQWGMKPMNKTQSLKTRSLVSVEAARQCRGVGWRGGGVGVLRLPGWQQGRQQWWQQQWQLQRQWWLRSLPFSCTTFGLKLQCVGLEWNGVSAQETTILDNCGFTGAAKKSTDLP